MTDHPALSLFRKLLVPSPSGDENRVGDVIRNELDSIGYAHNTDPAGNIIVNIPGKTPSKATIIFAAHMDEIGMVVTRIEKNGELSVTASGGLYPWKLGESPVNIFGDQKTITGILSMGSTHTKDPGQKTITWTYVRIITGLDPSEIKSSGIRPGCHVLPIQERRGPVVFGPPKDPLVGAWTFDDRMGCVTLLRLLQSIQNSGIQPSHNTLIAFTTSEEIGGHGAKYLTRSTNPEVFISIDGIPMPPESNLKLDGRPGIWVKDRLAQYDQELIRRLAESAIRVGTELQPVVLENAASDASLASYALGLPRIGCIGHVRENSHGFEVAKLSVFDHLLETLLVFLVSYEI
jgi:putative aminopeptidase FrvX